MFHIWCFMLDASCLMLHVPCLMLHVSYFMFDVSCLMLHVWCLMLDVSCFMFDVPCLMLHVWCFIFHVWCFMFDASCLMFDVSCLMFHDWCFIFHVSCFLQFLTVLVVFQKRCFSSVTSLHTHNWRTLLFEHCLLFKSILCIIHPPRNISSPILSSPSFFTGPFAVFSNSRGSKSFEFTVSHGRFISSLPHRLYEP